MPLEGQEEEKVKIKVIAKVEKTSKTTKIEKIELIKDEVVQATKTYNGLQVEDTFEVDENGTYRIKAITDQGKSKSKKVEVNVQSIASSIQISAEPTTETARNTENPGTKNGIETGPIIVTIEYEEIGLKKQYSIDGENWTNVEESSVKIPVTENIRVRARYTDEINSYKLVKYDVQNVDNVAPTFTKYDATVSGTTVTATGEATDTASDGAKSGIEGILRYEYSIDGENYQNENIFTVNTSGNYTIYIKAIDKAGNETIVSKTVEVAIYTITYDANGGTGAPETQIKIGGQDLILSSTYPTRSGYAFAGWAENDKTIAEYTTESVYSKDKDAYFYAVWIKSSINFSSSSEIEKECKLGVSPLFPVGTKITYSISAYYVVTGMDNGHSIYQQQGFDLATTTPSTTGEYVIVGKTGGYVRINENVVRSSGSFVTNKNGETLSVAIKVPEHTSKGTSSDSYYWTRTNTVDLTIKISN